MVIEERCTYAASPRHQAWWITGEALKMKNRSVAAFLAVSALGLGTLQTASAADMARRAAPVAVPVAPPVYNWTGFYFGGHAGWGWNTSDSTTTFAPGGLLFPGTGLAGGAADFGVSNDTAESHRTFEHDQKLQFPLVADPQGTVANAYGVRKTVLGFDRVTFLVDKEGRIARVFSEVDPAVHAEEVLEHAKHLR